MPFHFSDAFAESLLLEDCPYGDLTTDVLGIGGASGRMSFSPRAPRCTVSGIALAAKILRKAGLEAQELLEDGSLAEGCPCLLAASGRASGLHRAWKTAQNVLEYMTGIATRTAQLMENARRARPDIAVAVTRKNFPGAKLMCLAAATDGGASVHRAGLSESVLVFDRHMLFLEGEDKIRALKERLPLMRAKAPEKRLVAEASTLEEASRLAAIGLDAIQLDKFSPADLAQACRIIRQTSPGTLVLAAGGINASNAYETALQGPDVLVTSWVYFGKPQDIKVDFERAAQGA